MEQIADRAATGPARTDASLRGPHGDGGAAPAPRWIALAALGACGAGIPAAWSVIVGDGPTGLDARAIGVFLWATFTVIALVQRSASLDGPTRRLFLIDALWVTLAYWFIVWSVVLWPPARDVHPANAPGFAASATCFAAVAVLVLFVLSLVLAISPLLVWGTAAAAVAAVGEVAVTSAQARGDHLAGMGSNLWILSWAALALVALRQPDRVPADVVRTTLRRQLAIYVPVGCALVVSTVQNVVGDRPSYALITAIGLSTGVVFVVREIAGWAQTDALLEQRQQAADQMRWAATHDDLTGLLNRAALADVLDTTPDSALAVLFIDLDHFKVINDSLGHLVGDQVLRTTATRLRAATTPGDELARFGGDEFVVVLRGPAALVDPTLVAERLRASIARPIHADRSAIVVTASIGVTTVDRWSRSVEVLRDADTAMYRAKALGRDRVESLLQEDHQASVRRQRTTSELQLALAAGEIVPHFQPIVDLSTERIVGFEVLARWAHPERGTLSPEHFLGVAEETGLIGALGDAVLHQALATLARWRRTIRGADALSLTVNASIRQLIDEGFPAQVGQALRAHRVPADRLWLDLTEAALMTDTPVASATAARLRELGVHLAVEDFGTGYSSLSYLRQFPVEAIKVHASVTAGLGRCPDDHAMVAAVVGLGHALDLRIVAEGVEHAPQAERLRSLSCDLGQGYLFGRPMSASDATTELRRRG